jgi:hypothetical protein
MDRAPNYEEFSASRRRKRAVQESTAAATAAEAAAASSSGPAEDAFMGAARAQCAVLLLIALQLFCLLFELMHPLLAAWASSLSSRPGLAGASLVIAQVLPPGLVLLRRALGFLAHALWLASFAEVALFFQAGWAARGTRGLAGLAASLLDRPLRAVDALAVLLLGSSLLFAVGPRAFFCATARPRRAPPSTHPHAHEHAYTHTRHARAQWAKRRRCCSASSAWRTLCSCCWASCPRAPRRARGSLRRKRTAPTPS